MRFRKEKGETSFGVIVAILILIIVILSLILATKKSDKPQYESIEEKDIPIPEGYYYVGGTKDTGLIISDNIEDENAEKYTAQDKLKGNQWVWVPVEDINKIIKDKKDKKDYHEPYLVTGSRGNSFDYTDYAIAGFTSHQNMEEEIANEYKLMLESIEKYKGFYIGRYELSENGVKKGKTQSKKVWYELYKNCKEIDKDNEAVISTMIWGVQWDATCTWLSNSNYNTEDSTAWGNYTNNTAQGAGEQRETGYSENWKANNIYDFAGNYWEWTQEAYKEVYRVTRGGHWEFNGSRASVSSYDSYLPTNETNLVSRN